MQAASIPLTLILALATAAAYAGPYASGPADTPPVEAEPAADAETAAKAEEELKLPPGFKKVKRGKHTLYCKKVTPLGTRFQTDQCFDEPGMRNYILALQETKGDVDRIRQTCSNLCVCGDPSAC